MSFPRNFLSKIAIAALLALSFGCAAWAQTIVGVVTNKTSERPSGGDDVVLLKLAQGMQELTRSKTDSKGRFTIKVPAGETDSLHMIRVTHQKANYFQPVQPGTQSVEVEVYDAAPVVEGVSLSEDVMQVQSEPDGHSLRVVEHFLVKNASSPALTLMSDHPFEFNLPEGATVEGAAAKAPGGMAVQSQPVPLGPPGQYTLIFPVRPGDTEFHVWYHVPYTGKFTFRPKPTMDTANLAVMLPKSMTFQQWKPTTYQTVTEDVGVAAQAFVAQNAKPSEPLEFTVDGTGQLPRDTAAAQAPGAGAEATTAAGAGDVGKDTRPGGGLGVPVDKDAERDPLTKYRWWILGGLGLALAAGAGFLLKSPSAAGGAARYSASLPPIFGNSISSGSIGASSLDVLRNEMFAVETDRLEGRLSDAEYTQLKSAFDVVLRRALARHGTAQVVTE